MGMKGQSLLIHVEEFSGVVVLAYAFMSNHFHIFIYVPSAECPPRREGDRQAICNSDID
jgi:REP element-mobilizing transposase RayT